MKVIFTRPAQAGLREIARFIARGNPSRAMSFVAALRAKALDIGNMPLGFPVVERYERQGIRRRNFGNYAIFSRVDPDRVLILEVLHAARDVGRVLAPDE